MPNPFAACWTQILPFHIPAAVIIHHCKCPSGGLPALAFPESQHLFVQAQVRVVAQTDNVAGVKIPKFEHTMTGGEGKMGLTGLGKGGQQVQQCRKVHLMSALSIKFHSFHLLSVWWSSCSLPHCT